jgi:hypothetical protein
LHGPSRRRSNFHRWFQIGILLLLLLTLTEGFPSIRLRAQEEEETAANRELRIKAAYLYQFGR